MQQAIGDEQREMVQELIKEVFHRWGEQPILACEVTVWGRVYEISRTVSLDTAARNQTLQTGWHVGAGVVFKQMQNQVSEIY